MNPDGTVDEGGGAARQGADALATASSLVAERFPDPVLAVLAGSVARGAGTTTSDLDVVVVIDGDPAPYRETLRADGWLVELFVHCAQSLQFFYDRERSQGRCTLAHMLAEGAVLAQSPGAASVVDDARAVVDDGPTPLDPAELDLRRYLLTAAVDDLVGTDDPDERDVIAGQVMATAADLLLRGRGRWVGGGKWLYRLLKEGDPLLARRLLAAHRAATVSGVVNELVTVVEEVLAEFGGRLDVGFAVRGFPSAASR